MVEIQLTRGMVAIVDDEDADLASVPWHAARGTRTWYARRGGGYRRHRSGQRVINPTISLHRVIAKRARLAIDGLEVDHIDGDGLNCRRSNLRPATRQQNARNSRAHSNSTSGHKGITWDTSRGKWLVTIRTNMRPRSLGRYSDFELAAFVYEEAAIKYHGAFARPA